MKKLIYPALLLVFLAVAGMTFLTIAAPTGLIREQLVSLVKKNTGRDLIINGETSFSFFPSIGIKIKDVSLSGPPSNPKRLLLKMDGLTANVSLLPLIRQKIEVNSFVLSRPVFDLWVDRKGVPSWQFTSRSDGQPAIDHAQLNPKARLIRVADKPLPPELQDFVRNSGGNSTSFKSAQKIEGIFKDLRLEQVSINNGTLRYEDQRTGVRQELEKVDLHLALDTLDNPLDVEGGLLWKGEVLNFDGRLVSPKNVLLGHSSDLKLNISAKPVTATFNGSMAVGEGFIASGNLSADISALDRLLNWVAPGSAGSLGGAGSIETQINVAQTRTDLKKIKFTLRGVAGDGNITVATNGQRPSITGDLRLARLDIIQLMSGGRAKLGGVPTSRGAMGDLGGLLNSKKPLKMARATDDDRSAATTDWSRAPIDVSALNSLDAQVVLTVDQMNHGKVKLTDGRLVTLLNNGLLRINVERISLYGGRGTGRVSVDGARGVPQISASMLINGVSALPLLKDAMEFDWIDGRGQIAINVAGAGKSQDAIVRSLKGDGRLTFNDGAIVGINIPQMVRSFQTGQISGFSRNASQKTDFSELSGTFTIANGVASNKDLQLVGPLLRMTGAGRVDIHKKSIDYNLKPKLVGSLEGQGGESTMAGIEIPISVRGPWASPSITPDLQGLLTNSDQTVDAAKKMFKGFKKQLEGGDVEGMLKGFFGDK